MKIFLTGGTGFIGQALVKALLARKWQVTVLVRNPGGAQARLLSEWGADCVKGDALDRDSMRSAMKQADIVIHNAGMYEYGVDAAGRKRMHEVNVKATEQVLGLALELGSAKVVYVSSVVNQGNSGGQLRDESYQREHPFSSYYEQSKTEAHRVAVSYLQKGLPLVIASPSQVIGPNDHSVFGYLIRMYLNGVLPPAAWGKQTPLAVTYVQDTGEGIALAAEKGRVGESYLLSAGHLPLGEILRSWSSWPGAAKHIVYLPASLAAVLFAPMAPLLRLLGLPPFISYEGVRALVPLQYSGEKARRELGWAPVPPEEAFRLTLEEELRLKQKRKGNLISRLKPLEP